jgi:pimeloyl-ACP methyl ester carboxylesterase
VEKEQSLIDLKEISVPTLVICGDEDPYLDYDRVNSALENLPAGSALEIIEGASHVAFLEKPYYHDFQESVKRFLEDSYVLTSAVM